jgi:hypothetical protein
VIPYTDTCERPFPNQPKPERANILSVDTLVDFEIQLGTRYLFFTVLSPATPHFSTPARGVSGIHFLAFPAIVPFLTYIELCVFLACPQICVGGRPG